MPPAVAIGVREWSKTGRKPDATRPARGSGKAADAQPAALLDDIEALDGGSGADGRLDERFLRTPAWKRLSVQPPDVRASVIVEAVRRLGTLRRGIKSNPKTVLRGNLHREAGYSFARMTALVQLFRKPPSLSEEAWGEVMQGLALYEVNSVTTMRFLPALAVAFYRHATKQETTDAATVVAVRRIIAALRDPPTSGHREKALIAKLQASLP